MKQAIYVEWKAEVRRISACIAASARDLQYLSERIEREAGFESAREPTPLLNKFGHTVRCYVCDGPVMDTATSWWARRSIYRACSKECEDKAKTSKLDYTSYSSL